jgi:ketosteroid isomerase-like protein
MKKIVIALLVAASTAAPALAVPIPAGFASTGQDRREIEALLSTYTTAVSTKDQALFEGLLLDKDIPFSGVGASDRSDGRRVVTTNYDDFRKGVFQGPPFTQRFQDVHIDQDGRLAAVSLVFVNTAADGTSWGWKTLQLLKVGGRWKIASEFYTGHAG